MVHLAAIPTNKDIEPTTVDGVSLDKLKLDHDAKIDDSEFSNTVYGSKYAILDLPKFEMPEDEMPKEIAYRMIK
jgi:glutamate decarboxylase